MIIRPPFAAVPVGSLGRWLGCVAVLGVRWGPGPLVLACVFVFAFAFLCCVWVVFPGGGVSLRGAAVCLWGGVSGASPVVMSLSSLTVLIAASHRRLDPYWGAVFALAPCH